MSPRTEALRRDWPVWTIMLLCAGVEGIVLAANWGWVGSSLWRRWAYANGAFWAGLLADWRPNYAAQPAAMFLTYSVLHAGPGHLAGNLASLWVLGRHLCRTLGPRAFLGIYVLSALGGAATYALLATSPSPMVGASGAIFGLAGAAVELERARRPGWGRAAAGYLGLAVLNAATWALAGGHVAWQAHLGGAVAGACVVAALRLLRAQPARAKSRS